MEKGDILIQYPLFLLCAMILINLLIKEIGKEKLIKNKTKRLEVIWTLTLIDFIIACVAIVLTVKGFIL